MTTINFEETYLSMHANHAFLLRYIKEAIGVKEIEWNDLTAFNLMRIADYIRNKVSSNSAVCYFAILKSFLNLMSEDVDLPTMKFTTILKCKKEPQQNIALSEEEVARIDSYYCELMKNKGHNEEKDVLTLFLIECYCGGRGVDVEKMTVSNIENGRLSYVSKKTHTLATMPAHHRLSELLCHKPQKEYSRVTKNRIIKKVCKKCGIDDEITIFYHGKMTTRKKYEYCGFHTARRSFASMLAAKGVPIAEISNYMSHKSISMTERYIKINNNHSSDAAMSFFAGC